MSRLGNKEADDTSFVKEDNITNIISLCRDIKGNGERKREMERREKERKSHGKYRNDFDK